MSATMGAAHRPTAPAPCAAPPNAAELPPLRGTQLVLGTICLSLATFMNVLDSSIANVSIPAIAGDMGVSPTQGTWVITSFAVANAISMPLTGWLTQRFGSVRLFTTSILLFVITSWLCGLAPSIETLIFFRVLQGLVAGPMIPLSQALLLSSYPRAKAGSAMAMWAMTVLVAPVVGPLLGGWITDNIAWPWIFYINIPVGLVAAAMTWSIFSARESPRRVVPLDRIGLVLLVLWVGALQIMVDKGKELDWFASGQIVALALVALIGFIVFLVWELGAAQPLVDLALFAQRNFLMGTVALSVAYGVVFGNIVLLPLWLQQTMGYTATWAGLAMAPVGLLALVLSPWVGKNIGRIDPRRMATFAFIVFAAVMWMRSRFTPLADFQTILMPTLLQGVAMAFFFIPLQSIAFAGIPAARMPAAAGLNNFVRITAGAVGTSLSTTLWERRAGWHHAQLAQTIDSGNATAMQTLAQLQAQGFSAEQALGVLNRMIDQQAFTMAAADVFRLSSWLFIALIALVWFSRPQAGSAAAGGAH
ncbi:MAG: DHA2 family efflux MFS transporter permease subunit [Rubrivivax sp.]